MSRREPTWLPDVREVCRRAGITIAGWGDDTLSVYAESPERVAQITGQFRPLGFEPVEDADDATAGLLLLSRNPAGTRAKQHSGSKDVDISQRPLVDRASPALVAVLCLWCFWYGLRQPAPKLWIFAALATMLLLITLREGRRLLGWRLEMSSAALRVRLNFRWHIIPWTEITRVETTAVPARSQEGVTLMLASSRTFPLGSFNYRFARALRDQLRRELTLQRGT